MRNNMLCGVKNIIKGYLKVIYCKFNSGTEPVLILTMGKVGSSSVYESLRNKIGKCSVFHIHFLSRSSINKYLDYFRSKNICTPYHVAVSMALRKAHKKDNLKYISLVREPISRTISDYFQNYKKYHPELLSNNNGQLENIILNDLLEEINSYDANDNYEVEWFENEIIDNLGINIYNNPFDYGLGYTIYKDDGCNNNKLLIIRLDDLNRIMKQSIYEFMGADIEQISKNVGKDKEYSRLYKYVVDNIKIDEKTCRNIYSSKYMRYFYKPKEIEAFVTKWAK